MSRSPIPRNPDRSYYGSRIRLYDIAADRFVDRFPAFKGDAQDLAFTERRQEARHRRRSGGMVRMWDVETGKEERSFHVVPEAVKKQSYFVRRTRFPRTARRWW